MRGIILYIVASALFFPIAMLNLIVSLYKTIKQRMFYRETDKKFFASAKGIDVFANEAFPVLWNTLLRKSGGYTFGHKGETLSSTLGKIQLQKKLPLLGWLVVVVLYIVDVPYWGKGGHCLNSIDK